METVGNLLREASARLRAAGIEAAEREARLLLQHALGLPPAAMLDREAVVAAEGFAGLVARRAGREPLAFVVGSVGFWTLELEVSPVTLIPRADSETLIEAAVAACGRVERVLDLGTGTGALLLAALVEFPAAFGVGVDLVPGAAALAARNAGRNGLAGRAAFLAGDWAAAIGGRFDLVLANPPYIESAAIAGLEPEVARHEPGSALDGGVDGLAAYRRLVAALPGLLAEGGVAVLELGQGQAEAVAALGAEAGLRAVTREDLGGIARAMVLR